MRDKGDKKLFKENCPRPMDDNFYLSSNMGQDSMGYTTKRLETMDLRSELAFPL